MKDKSQQENQRHILRLLKLLSKQSKRACQFHKSDETFILNAGEKHFQFGSALVSQMKVQRLIDQTDNTICLTNAGLTYLKQALNPDCLLACSNNKIKTASVLVNNDFQSVNINTNESPLMRLITRKTKTGSTYLSMEEFQAGERLRKDFERGQLQPKISASLESRLGSSGKKGYGNANDINDFALDARSRVGKAVEKLGPELSGVTLDICCFLKGLECVERERQWPPRSAKLMLKTALSLLARHYGIAGYENRSAHKNHSWGASDYRPELSI